MVDEPQTEVGRILEDIRSGDPAAEVRLFEFVYDEIRLIADGMMRRRPHDSILQPTAVIHEAWLKLVGQVGSIESRKHFFSLASMAIRQVLADSARARRAEKRGGPNRSSVIISAELINEHALPQSRDTLDLCELSDALEKLGTLNDRHAQVVQMRLFGAMTIDEIADVLGVSRRTVDSDWNMARAWLARELR
jgi:RNA polymerase sigma factor (TIGR02999 family)